MGIYIYIHRGASKNLTKCGSEITLFTWFGHAHKYLQAIKGGDGNLGSERRKSWYMKHKLHVNLTRVHDSWEQTQASCLLKSRVHARFIGADTSFMSTRTIHGSRHKLHVYLTLECTIHGSSWLLFK